MFQKYYSNFLKEKNTFLHKIHQMLLYRSHQILLFHYAVDAILLVMVAFSIFQIVQATTPNPGHPWSELGDGVFVFTNSQTVTPYTYTFPAANTAVLTTNALVTVAQGGTGLGTLTLNNVILGNGTATPQFVAPGSLGNVLYSDGTTWTSSAGHAGDMLLAGVQTVTGAKTFGGPGAVGKLIIAGNTSGSTILDATAVAGSGTVTLPTTGTLATLAGSEAFTNKTYNGLTVTSTTGTLTMTAGKTLSVSKSLTLDGTDSTTMTFPTTSATIARTDAAQTFTGIQTFGPSSTYDPILISPVAKGTTAYNGTITSTDLTAARNWTFPDNGGTVALTSDIPSLTGYLLATGATVGATSQAQAFTNGIIGGSSTTSALTLQTTSGVGTIGADMHFKVGNNGATEAFTILNSGNVGIGTITPTYKLDIQGTTTTSGVNSQAGYNINTVTAPIAIGSYALATGTNLGVGQYYYFVTYTTALGETSAGATLSVTTTTGNTNVQLSGIPTSTDARVTGRKIYRTKLGTTSDNEYYLAVIADNITTTYTDSTADTSLTGGSLQFYKVNTTSKYISTAGTRSMIIDSNLTTLGLNAGNNIIANNAPAVRSVLIGTGAGQNLTTGQANVIVGVAGGLLTTGGSNTLVGDLAAYNNQSTSNNSVFGSQAARFLTTGGNMIALGSGAGSYLNDGATQLTSSSSSIYVGFNARGFANGETNAIVIGSTALGLGSNTAVIGNNTITKTVLFGNLGIGTTAPTSIFALNGTAARTIQMERNTTAATAGMGLTLSSGGAIAGTADLAGGDLTLKSGTSTGTGSSAMHFFTATAGTTAVTDRAPTEKMTILGSGNVGIGTTAPSSLLTLQAQAAQIRLIRTDNTTNSRANVVMSPSGALSPSNAQWSFGMSGNDANSFDINTFDGTTETNRVRILDTGNVGIGTTNPGVKLDVNGGVVFGTGTRTSGSPTAEITATAPQLFFTRAASTNSSRLFFKTGETYNWNFGMLANSSDFTVVDEPNSAVARLRIKPGAFAGDNLVIDGTSGNIGIGTTTPTNLLEIKKATSGNILSLHTTSVTSGDYNGLTFKISNDTSDTYKKAGIFYERKTAYNDGILHFAMDGTADTSNADLSDSKMAILTNGNVGIGTTAPTNILSLSGTAARTIWMERNTTAATAGMGLTLSSGGAIAGTADLAGGDLTLSSGISTGTGTSNIHFLTANGGTSSTTDRNPTEKMTILGNGSVGINNTSPSTLLQIGPSINTTNHYQASFGSYDSTTGYPQFLFNNPASRFMAIGVSTSGDLVFGTTNSYNTSWYAQQFVLQQSTGNIGIGTTAPTSLLALNGTAARTIQMERNTTAATAGMGLTVSSGGAIAGTADLAGGDLTLKSGTSTGTGSSAMHFFTATAGTTAVTDRAPTEKMTILGNGNVGIGTTAPGVNRLSVSATGNSNALNVVDATGNVLIGTATDITAYGGAKLQVKGGASAVSTWSGRIIAGGNTSVFLMGEIDSRAVLAGHNSSLSAWDNLYINPVNNANTYIGNSGSWPTTLANTTLSVVGSNVGIGITNPGAKLDIQGIGNGTSGLLSVGSTSTSARGTLARIGYYSYWNMDSSGSTYWNWGTRYDGEANQWVRAYTSANNYLPYTRYGTDGKISFGGAVSNLTTDINPTMSDKVTFDMSTGNVGIGTTSPTAYLHLKAGTATLNTAPLKFTSGTNLTTAETGAMEYDGTSLYFTPSGTTRKTVAYLDSTLTGTANIAGGTLGAVPYQTAANTTGVVAATATANKMFLSGASAIPTWSTSTIPTSAGATANKVLLSDGTNYVLSTPTFPNASATALKTIRSDGTNWIASTATISDTPSTAGKMLVSDGTNWITSTPTFPNASATARKIIVSDGTNWTASTETYAVATTSGNVLTSDGTNWTSATPSVKLNQIAAANGTATIDSLTNAIAWNWSTATTQNPFSLSANALTSGKLLSLSSSATTTLTSAGTNVGSLLDITESGAMTAFTGSLASINASGANAVGATGNALAINIAGTAQLMKGIKFNTATTGTWAQQLGLPEPFSLL